MNRSFWEETVMQVAALKQRQQLRASAMKEKEEELALFLEMRRREREQSILLLNHSSGDFDAPLGSKSGASPIFNLSASTTTPVRNTGDPARSRAINVSDSPLATNSNASSELGFSSSGIYLDKRKI
ncbi:hypothetical protein V6N13_067352 [Hibiscus sabdariffa]|uniref:Uncharacterized protein n=1 Tax=Hibiscus sabdariffa TaxID=183260 RepID=A0ABR2DT76_9ROSI